MIDGGKLEDIELMSDSERLEQLGELRAYIEHQNLDLKEEQKLLGETDLEYWALLGEE